MAARRGIDRLILRVLLDAAFFLATPFVLLLLLIPSRGFTRRRYRAGMVQRLGWAPRRAGSGPCLWLHAVSVGELRAALPLVEALTSKLPGWEVWVSTGTDTGQELAARSLPSGVRTFYFPLDYGFAVRRALRRVRPEAVVLLELELWPSFLLACEEAGVPVLVVNGRITERSSRRYRRLGFLSRRLFSGVAAFAAQSEEYARRFESLGVPRERIQVLGNLKYDGAPAPEDGSTARRLGWTSGASPVLVAGCTHPGEEETVLGVWSRLRAEAPGLRLVLAPRHIERAGEVEALLSSKGLPVLRWSRAEGREEDRVVLVDRVGELDRFYRLADLVFVGGSLVPRGGHNLLEPARLGKPVLFGPFTSNFEEIAGHLLAREGALRVGDGEELAAQASRLLRDPRARKELGARARAAASELAGATARHLSWIEARIAAPEASCPHRPPDCRS